MISVQLGAALSVGLVESVGPGGAAWMRLMAGAGMFIAFFRPRLSSVRRQDLPGLIGLGVATGLTSIALLAAIERIPLGSAIAIQFLGPLTVAAVRAHSKRAIAWPLLALMGVVLVTQPWQNTIDFAGVVFAAFAGLGWGIYIVLTQHVGGRFDGIRGLSFTIPIAAITAAAFGIPQAAGSITLPGIAAALGLAALVPVIPCALDLIVLRRMKPTAFGTLMALEPAIALVLGLLILNQVPKTMQLIGILIVVVAAVGAQGEGESHLAA
ncbi:EamA family transporter [Rhodococcus sp. KBS0724]|nr:EamA family transporter [Rhodococcus sp. KBS0724]